MKLSKFYLKKLINECLNEQNTYVNKNDVYDIVRYAFPNYNGQKYKISIRNSYNIQNYWSEGSKEYYVIMKRINGRWQTFQPNASTTNPFMKEAHQTINISNDMLIVTHTIFSGRDLGITINISSNSIYKDELIKNKQNISLTDDEKIVLVATKTYKNTYGGKSNIRFKYASRETGITPERWVSAYKSLQLKKLLNSSGAITMNGRNAISGHFSLNDFRKNR